MKGTIGAVVLGAILAAPDAQLTAPERGSGSIIVDAVVEASDGRPVSDLRQEDFDVLVDGQPRPIQIVERDRRSLSVVLLVDVTNSVTGAGMRAFGLTRTQSNAFGTSVSDLKKAAEGFLGSLGPGDRARIGAVCSQVSLSPAFTSDARQMVKAAGRVLDRSQIERSGPSRIWDAIDAAVGALEKETGRRTIVLFTDGRASGNVVDIAEVADHAVAAGVSVNIVAPFEPLTILQDTGAIVVRPDVPLRALADLTGGVFLTEAPASPDLLLTTVLPRVRVAYRLGFAGGARDGALHRRGVRVKGEGLTVRARKGYVESR